MESGTQLKIQIPLTIKWNPESLGSSDKEPESGTWNLESTAWNPESQAVLDSFVWGNTDTKSVLLPGIKNFTQIEIFECFENIQDNVHILLSHYSLDCFNSCKCLSSLLRCNQ